MSVSFSTGSIVANPGQQFSLSGNLAVSGNNNPAYLLLTGLDRNEYTAASTGAKGAVSGNGQSQGFTGTSGGDGNSFGILFTYNAATGQYVNSTYGNLSSMTMTASTDKTRTEALSLFGSNSAGVLQQYQSDPVSLMVSGTSTYLGTLDVVTQPNYGAAPSQATPGSIAAIAQTFVGQAWNSSGCWVLANNIAAEAGASLPLSSTLSAFSGLNNGEWMVAYNGPAGSSGDWKSMVQAGDIVSFTTPGGTGHITTVVSGSGSTAKLVDNITYVDASGKVVNSANDGSAKDVLIAAPHAAYAEFSGVSASSVVVYRLDTPVVGASGPIALAAGQSVSLGGVLSATDPAGKAVTTYQLYDTTAGDSFTTMSGTATATSAGSAITVSASQLASTVVKAGTGMSSVANGQLVVRAYNGSYWGDWTNVAVSVTPSTVATTAANVVSNLATLNAAAVAGTLQAVTLTDAGKPVVDLSGSQLTSYRSAIDKITGNYILAVTSDTATSTLVGSNGVNRLVAGTSLMGSTLNAGASTKGHDTLQGGVAADVLNGSQSAAGAAILVAGSGANALNGGLGYDTLYGGGRSVMQAGAANQLLLGGYTAASRDTLTGSAGGHDFLAVANGHNLLSAGSGTGSVLEGGAGADALYGSATTGGSAILVGGSGASTLNGGLGADTLVGGGASLLIGGTGRTVLLGGFSAGAHDTLNAGTGANQVLAVGMGNNVLRADQTGQGSGDVLYAGSGSDTLYGGASGTTFGVGDGQTSVVGGAGDDTVVVNGSHGSLAFDGGAGNNTVYFAGASEGNAAISTSNGLTTVAFSNSAEVATLRGVSTLVFAGSNSVHHLA